MRISLSRVGVREVERVIRIGVDGRSAQPFATRLECLVEPGADGLAASVERAVAEALGELALDDAGIRAERLAQCVAETVRETCAAQRAIVTLAARFPERRPAPVSGVPLMKRSDEAAIVERAHRRPRLVEDCVHAMIAGVLERFSGLPDDVFVLAAQENVETVRGHHLVAERAGLLGDLRRAPGGAPAGPASLGEWLADA